MMRAVMVLLGLFMSGTSAAQEALDGRAIIAKAFEAAGGERWARVKSLILSGNAVFYGAGPEPRSRADDYRMWRVYEDVRVNAHAEAGKVRIEARHDGRPMFLVGSDGETSFNEKGVIPKAQADAFWAENFGFGVIRSAMGPGFKLQRLPDDSVDGHPSYMVRVTDPSGSATLFGIDKAQYFIRLAGFATPRGWHVRIYDDFRVTPGWTQPGVITLYYNGVIANKVFWTGWEIDPEIDPLMFSPPRP